MAALVLVFAVSCTQLKSQKTTAPVYTYLQNAANEMAQTWQVVLDNDQSVYLHSPKFLLIDWLQFCAYHRVRLIKNTATTFQDINKQFLNAERDVYYAVKQADQDCAELDDAAFFQSQGMSGEFLFNSDMMNLAEMAVTKFWLKDAKRIEYIDIETYEPVARHCMKSDTYLDLIRIALVSKEYDDSLDELNLNYYLEYRCFDYDQFDWNLVMYVQREALQ